VGDSFWSVEKILNGGRWHGNQGTKWLPNTKIHNFFNAPFFVSMATAEKFVQPIPIFLAYLVPLDVVLFL
jgi:hypothetical protein